MEKTLSNKRILDQNMNGEMVYTESDVKKHLQEFKEELNKANSNLHNLYGLGKRPFDVDEFFIMIGNEIDTQMQKHFGKDLI